MKRNFNAIEKKWQKRWEEKKIFNSNENSSKKKFYCLEMFPYPSGSGLHLGHALNFTITDIFARFKRMQGFNVKYPIGYDALGLPAENAAIQSGTHPEEYTKNSIKNFMLQQQKLGLSYDDSTFLNTADSNYYKWDQWIFLKLLKKDLAYKKTSNVNWCKKCNTVLANEQVQEGKCWRHEDTKVEIKNLEQWFFKTTHYADELYEGLNKMNWPKRTKIMQRNWIGKSYGTEIDFEIFKEIQFADYLLIEKSFDLDIEKELIKFGKFQIEETDKDWGRFFRVKIPLNEEENFINFVKKNILTKNKYGGSWYADSGGTTNRVIFREKVIDLNSEKGKKEFFEYGKKLGIPKEQLDIKIPNKKWSIFTTRPDTLFGVTFMVVSAQHLRLSELVTDGQKKEVENFLKKLKSVSEKELKSISKEGVFTGSYARNPINGEKIPVYAGNFVLADYGSGMIMAVPAHDQRDFEFAKKYKIPIKIVIQSDDFKLSEKFLSEAYRKKGVLINSKEFDGIDNEEAKEKITTFLEEKKFGRKTVNFKLRDWGISRQRYWGTPIPIINCKKCGVVPVPEKDLPVKLPHDVEFGKGNPLKNNKKWVNVECPKCGGKGKRETDTMDTFTNSSWYFLRYCDPKNNKKIFEKKKVKYWCPVDFYVGGSEHACMHLIYSRFYIKFLRDLGLISFDEPTLRLFHQGMLHAKGGAKMSKSLGNTINPLDIIKKYNADSLRLALMSFASPDKDTDWDEKVLIGSYKILNKIEKYFDSLELGKTKGVFEKKLNQTVKKVTKYIEGLKYRKATIEIRQIWELIFKEKKISRESLEKALKLLSLFCPHLSEELYERLGNKEFLSLSSWPKFDNLKIKEKRVEIDLNSKVINLVKGYLKNKKVKKIYLYVMPFEVEKLDEKKLKKELGKGLFIYSTSDNKKYDPEGKAKKAKPGMPGVWFE